MTRWNAITWVRNHSFDIVLVVMYTTICVVMGMVIVAKVCVA